MIPSDWTPCTREDDGELLGYLQTEDGRTVPLTLFGYPLAPAGELTEAVSVLEARGLAALAERWRLRTEDGREVTVLILAAYPDGVQVAQADYGFVSHDSARFTVPVPTEGRLQPG